MSERRVPKDAPAERIRNGYQILIKRIDCGAKIECDWLSRTRSWRLDAPMRRVRRAD